MNLKGKWKDISIKWKIFIFLALFVAFIIALLWVMQVVFLNDFYRYIKTNEIKKISSNIINNAEDEEAIYSYLGTLSDSSDFSAYIYSVSNPQVYYYQPDNRPLGLPERNIYIKKAQENDGSYIQYNYMNEEGEDIFTEDPSIKKPSRPSWMDEQQLRQNHQNIVYTTIFTFQEEEVALILYSNATPVNSTVQTIKSQLLIITGVLLSIALIIAFSISIIISKPITKINNTSKELAKGNYNVSFEGRGYKEIKELADTLNYAAYELSKVDGYRKELLANVSHDLRTPLTLITGYAEVMRDIPGEISEENIQTIIDETNRLTTIINDVLDISKYESNVQTLNLTEFNITQSLRELTDRISKMTLLNGYDISFEGDEDVYVKADEVNLIRAVYNLIGNAITYTDETKKVLVKQELKGSFVRINIIDSGEGIPQEQLESIWERYYKINKDHKRSQIGTGLGLSIVKSIFDLHKLRYGVISEIGKGSNFWVELKIYGIQNTN